ncbi:integral membrane sensor signal transduction histidine kinase [Leptolyngbya sp. NIES-3755]|nr:integral membrane sensor signal transduction histidine kinase [Leptolyngbya sp. NIES-3755]
MNPVFDFSPAFRRTLRYVEWTLVLGFILVNGIHADLQLIFLGWFAIAAFGLSWILPTHCPIWQRQIYLFVGLSLAISMRWLGYDWDLFLYFYIAKTCFLLDGKPLKYTLATITLLNLVAYYGYLMQRFQPPVWFFGIARSLQIWQWVGEYLLNYVPIVVFIVYLSVVVTTEQKSRRRAEVLSQQVETLAAALERTRIARDIHNSLGHLLTNLNARLSVAQAMRERDPTEAAEAVDMAKLLASQSIEEVKRSLQIIRRSDFDLNRALVTLMEQLRSHQALKVQWDIQLPSLPLPTQHHLYCMVKESLVNIQRHSQATEIRLHSHFTEETLCFAIEDNGQGFDPKSCSRGFGLQGIEERIQLLNGTFIIQSAPELGTQIQITLPL